LAITAPDGSPVKTENASTGKFRSTFDVPLAQPGTYKIAVVNNMVAAMYEDGGETKRWRGAAEAFAREVPAEAKNLQVSKTHSRTEVFVTSGKPTDKALQPSGVGLELVPITHPNDLVQGEAASFRLVRDGKPAVNVAIAVVPGGICYRDNLKEMAVSTDSDGKFTVTFPDAGMYWLSATVKSGGAPPAAAAGHQGWAWRRVQALRQARRRRNRRSGRASWPSTGPRSRSWPSSTPARCRASSSPRPCRDCPCPGWTRIGSRCCGARRWEPRGRSSWSPLEDSIRPRSGAASRRDSTAWSRR
jgi:Domain of unknown function (DUF4198)